MARLVLGPLLRYVGETEATIWVETDAPATVEVNGCSAPTFAAEGHHYALVHCRELAPSATTPYEVRLDGHRVWPLPEGDGRFPPSVIRTHGPEEPVSIAFGSCRVCAPHEPPFTLRKDEHAEGREIDALRGLAHRMASSDTEEWPHALLLLGDQVYADEVSPATKAFIAARRDVSEPPGDRIADFEEYTQLYREAWSEPHLRWLLSTIPTAMVFDDHDVHDDWNTSEAWVREIRAEPWWQERIVSGFASYWIYQHLGNLSPRDLAEDPTWAAVQAHAHDAGPILRELGATADATTEGTRWSYARDIGPARLVMIDSRAGRVLTPGERTMVDEEEFRWIEENATGDVDHLLIGSSLPILLAPGMHHLEVWNERVCDGAWGGLAARVGEKLRQGADLEHWAAFEGSFRRICDLLEAVGAGRRGRPPASIVCLSGDVHHAYLAEVGFPRGSGVRSAVWQAVCSPFRNPLDGHERRAISFAVSRPAAVIGRALARSAGADDPPIRWRFVHDAPWFDNQVATLRLDGREAHFVLEKTLPVEDEDGEQRLETVFERSLAAVEERDAPQASPREAPALGEPLQGSPATEREAA